MNVHKILTQIQKQELTIQEGETLLKQLPYEDLGFAKLDHHRELRSGFGEVVFCQGKSNEQIAEIYKCFAARGTDILGTRASQEQYIYVKERIPKVEYESLWKNSNSSKRNTSSHREHCYLYRRDFGHEGSRRSC